MDLVYMLQSRLMSFREPTLHMKACLSCADAFFSRLHGRGIASELRRPFVQTDGEAVRFSFCKEFTEGEVLEAELMFLKTTDGGVN